MQVKISELPLAQPLDGEELVPLVQAGETRRAPVSALLAALSGDEIEALQQALQAHIEASNPHGQYATTAAMSAALASKVDAMVGKALSSEDYTSAEKAKLAGIEGSHFKGTFLSLAALQAAHPSATAGDYADVDAGAEAPVLRHIWDSSDEEWVAQAGSAEPLTAAQIKMLYESNPDTNGFGDAEKSKLSGVAAGATANANTDSLAEGAANLYFTAARVRAALLSGLSLTDSTNVTATDSVLQGIGKLAARLAQAFDRSNHTGMQAISAVSGLQAALDKATFATVVTEAGTSRTSLLSDSGSYLRFTNAEEKTYAVAPQDVVPWAADTEIHGRNASVGTLALTPGSGVTLNAPYGGSLQIPTGGTFTLKRVAENVWDVIGQTVAA